MEKRSRVYVAGHRGLVGSAIMRKLQGEGHTNLITRTHAQLDLTDSVAVKRFFTEERPEFIFLAAARVGGIYANATQQTEFLYENLMIAANVIRTAADQGVEKLLFLGSSCIFPREAPQPMKEEHLLSGPLEPTNEGYAIAKIAGLKLCEYNNRHDGKRFISAVPTNLYGPNDHFHPLQSHVIPGMMRRFHEAKMSGASEAVVWGSGRPRREFLYVDDLAEALYLLMSVYEKPQTINVGTGQDLAISELAEIIRRITGFEGTIAFDSSKPDGSPRKLLDTSQISSLGWRPQCSLEEGLRLTYQWAQEAHVFADTRPLVRNSGSAAMGPGRL